MNCEPFLNELTASGWSPETVKAYRADLKSFAEFLNIKGIRFDRISRASITEYESELRNKGLSHATVSRRRAAVSSLFEYLRTMGSKMANPTRGGLRRKRAPRTLQDLQGKAIDQSSVDALLAGVTVLRDRALFLLLLRSGLRLAEVHQLDIDSIQESIQLLPDGTQRVIGGSGAVVGKGAKPREFYFETETALAIRVYISTRHDNIPALFISERRQRMSMRAIQWTLGFWCATLDLPHVNVHRFRHTFATVLANNQIESRTLQKLLGHSNFNTTTKYFRLTDQTTAREYYAAMEFARPPEA
jgi:site-specific recombinase XerD